MMNNIFDDEIINVSVFQNDLSHWFSMAAKHPVTIHWEKKITFINHEKIRGLYHSRYYLEAAVKLLDTINKEEENSVFPWLEYLDAEEKQEFLKEYISTVLAVSEIDNWDKVEELLDDWKATAETKSNLRVMKALHKNIHEKNMTIN